MRKIKFIYFDFGGVFFNWHNEFTTVAIDFGVSREQVTQIFNEIEDEITTGRMTTSEFWELCQKRLSLENGENYDFAKKWVLDYIPIKSTHKLVVSLNQDYKIGGLSNLYDKVSDLIFTYNRVPNIDFDPMIFSYQVGLQKPDINIFRLAQEKAGVAPQDILLVDDSKTNCDTADSLGWHTLVFDTYHPEDSVRKILQILK